MEKSESLARRYGRIYAHLEPLLAETRNKSARMATVAALLHHKLPQYFWTGFYILDRGQLTVGPYQGTLACLILAKNQGVCWAAVNRRETVVVPDVHQFPGHIACDSRSQSEIVVPLFDERHEVWAVLDVDSRSLDAFSAVDREWLEKIVRLI